MKKYSVLVRGENFLIKVEGEAQKLGFYTTAFVEAKDADEASKKAVDLLRDDQEFKRSVSNDQSDPPLHVSHLVERNSQVVRYLGLPAGWRFLIAGDHQDVWFDPMLLEV